jgi:hypothetical protein
MKLPSALSDIFEKKNKPQEYFLSLILDTDHVAGACWHIGPRSKPVLVHAVARRISADHWEERTQAADQVITTLEQRVGSQSISKAIFGLPAVYLTESGDIRQEVRSHLKKLTEQLSLSAIGFVSVHQAITHKLKQDEGVPPTVILIGSSASTLTVSLYKVGNLAGIKTLKRTDGLVHQIEAAFKEFSDVEVLPSRILLYGVNTQQLEAIKAEMTGHPWPTRANFLHFPKFEIVPADFSVGSVSLAGANELAKTLTEDSESTTSVPDPGPPPYVPEDTEKIEDLSSADPEIMTEDEKSGEKLPETPHRETEVTEFQDEAGDSEGEVEALSGKQMKEAENVSFVSAEELGFKAGSDILTQSRQAPPVVKESAVSHAASDHARVSSSHKALHHSTGKRQLPELPKLAIPDLTAYIRKIPNLLKMGRLPVIGGLILTAGVILYGFIFLVLPRATVAVMVLPEYVEESSSVVIVPDSQEVDPDEFVIPGLKLEKTVSGDKTVTVTGKKKVGDPAQGTVTVYNKSLSARTFKKGAVLSSGSLSFTLDQDVQVASASESIGSITFGKANVAITASAIGSAGNLDAGSEFAFKEISSGVAIARNEQSLSGGSSREVTVVSRADYDNLVTAVTRDLVDLAKEDLTGSVTGTQQLVDATIKTAVTDKKFSKELDQESKELQGTVTVAVSGIAYEESDLKLLLMDALKKKVSSGYVLDQDQVEMVLSKPEIKKDGTITADVSAKGLASPVVDVDEVRKLIAGKKLADAQNALREIKGVAGVEFGFRPTWLKDRLPRNISNITVTVSVRE